MSSKTEEELLEVEAQGKGGTQAQEDGPGSPETITLVEEGKSEGEDPVSALRGEVERWKDLALRSQAELDNFRKRMAREKSDAIRYGNGALLESLLPVVDNFRFGLEAARRDAAQNVVVEGMAMVYKQLNELLEENGVKEISAEGLPFDPNLHEAVKEEASDTVGEGYVISVVRKGFRLHDRLLRPANVIVSRGPAAAAEASPEQPGTTPGAISASAD